MKTPDDLLAGYRRFRAGSYREHAARFRRLDTGQNPDVMLIACCDSRADPALIFDAAPGELFVMRNVGNLVPPCECGGGLHGVSAALEFAVTSLEVEHIVVMGHGGCGGVKASLAGAGHGAVGEYVGPWVALLDAARESVIQSECNDPQTELEYAGIAQSLRNLLSFPFVAERVKSGALSLHGAWFAIISGELLWRNDRTGVFDNVDTAQKNARSARAEILS